MPFNRHEGTQTTTVPTEHTLATVTVAGNYVFRLDVNLMALADVMRIRIQEQNLEADSAYLISQTGTYAHVQGDGAVLSIPFTVSASTQAQVTINHLEGTTQDFKWSIRDMGPDAA